MILRFFFLLLYIIFIFHACCSSSGLILQKQGNLDENDSYYKNDELGLNIHFLPLFVLYNSEKKAEFQVYDKRLGLIDSRADPGKFLLYAESYDHERFSFIFKRYKSRISIQDFAQKNRFNNISIDNNDEVSYEKVIDNYFYHIIDSWKPMKNGDYLRTIALSRIDQSSRDSKAELASLIEFEKKQLRRLYNYTNSYQPDQNGWTLAEDHVYYFRENLNFDYGTLYSEIQGLDKKNLNTSHLTLFSFLGMNGYAKEEIKPIDFSQSVKGSYFPVSELEPQFKEHEILVINEDHHLPNCRFQLSKMLPQLKELGYQTLFLEAWNKMMPLNNGQGTVTHHSGIYLSDPTFANLVKNAQNLGMNVLGYEFDGNEELQSGESRRQMRERIQARNIVLEIEKRQLLDTSKVIIFCGYGHANEQGSKDFMPMTALLKKELNKEILTINQTHFLGQESQLTDKFATDSGVTYVMASKVLNKDGYDYYLWQDNSTYYTNSPDYIYEVGDEPTDFSCKNLQLDNSYLIVVYNANDQSNLRVPVFSAPYNVNLSTGQNFKNLI